MRLIIVSNRLPVTISKDEGKYIIQESPGGLATGVSSYLSNIRKSSSKNIDSLWVGWPGIEIPEHVKPSIISKFSKKKLYPVFLSKKIMDKFYLGFCNKTIWPLFHYFSMYASFDNDMWDTYKFVNHKFYEILSGIIKENDVVWIHDYHLMLLPKMLRNKFPDLKIGFFLHIPFPHYEIFRLMPHSWRIEILEGLIGSDLIGFHTYDYTKYFLGSVLRLLGLDNYLGEISLDDRFLEVDTFPMGIDFKSFENLVNKKSVRAERKQMKEIFKDKKILLSIDRLDYSKGILNRLEGYHLFLKQNPEWREKIYMLVVIVPSRIGVDKYSEMKKEIDETIGKINGTFGNINWNPIIYQYKNLPVEKLSSLYSISDIALITPLRDGMNLIAKEYLACKTDDSGVLILSEMAGASKELGEAIIINPNHIEDIASGIKVALEMDESEKIRINKIMKERLKTNDVVNWASNFISSIFEVNAKQDILEKKFIDVKITKKLVRNFKSAKNKIIFLDYDGTLVPFKKEPVMASPDPELFNILNRISGFNDIQLVIISGRDKNILHKWFYKLNASFVAEHGVWIKRKNKNWKLMKRMDYSWKTQMKSILKKYTDILSGSLVEEKSYSLVWHYRKSDTLYGAKIANELLDNLISITANMDLQVIPGNKIIEVRNSGINKGTAVLDFLTGENYDFILSIGDDWTDEDMFKALPDKAYTIKVGMSKSYAKYNLHNYNEVRNLLKEIINEK